MDVRRRASPLVVEIPRWRHATSLSELREMRIKLRYECQWKVDISHVSHLTRPDSIAATESLQVKFALGAPLERAMLAGAVKR